MATLVYLIAWLITGAFCGWIAGYFSAKAKEHGGRLIYVAIHGLAVVVALLLVGLIGEMSQQIEFRGLTKLAGAVLALLGFLLSVWLTRYLQKKRATAYKS